MANIDLTKYGITGTTEIVYNPSYELLFEEECAQHRNFYNPYGLHDGAALHLDTFGVSEEGEQHSKEHQAVADDHLPIEVLSKNTVMLLHRTFFQQHLGKCSDRGGGSEHEDPGGELSLHPDSPV